jgi:dehydrogenase/reductase SDR family member 12
MTGLGSLNSVLDRALDFSIAPGYSKLGYAIRSRSWSDALPQMDGRVVIVTGATSGLGRAAATGFAALGATVWIAVRDRTRGVAAANEIRRNSNGGTVEVELCDVSNLESVRQFAARMQERTTHLDVLVNNAGVMTQQRELSVDGIELTLATNVIGPFLLTNLLIPSLGRHGTGRVINVSSGGMYAQRLDVEDLQSERDDFSGPAAYARSKRDEVILTELLADAHPGQEVVFHSMHPGWADTDGVRDSLPRFHALTRPVLRSPEQGADTIVWLGAAAEPARCSGYFWHDRRRRPTHLVRRTRESSEDRLQLLAECITLSGGTGPSR